MQKKIPAWDMWKVWQKFWFWEGNGVYYLPLTFDDRRNRHIRWRHPGGCELLVHITSVNVMLHTKLLFYYVISCYPMVHGYRAYQVNVDYMLGLSSSVMNYCECFTRQCNGRRAALWEVANTSYFWWFFFWPFVYYLPSKEEKISRLQFCLFLFSKVNQSSIRKI